MARRTPGARSELIHCDACGEDYSSTYKRCPFCGEKPDKTGLTQTLPNLNEDDYVFDGGYVFDELDAEDGEDERPARGGKRLAGGSARSTRSSGGTSGGPSPVRIAGFVFTLVVILAALLIVTKVVVPMVQKGSVQVPDDTPGTSQSVEPSTSPDPNADETGSLTPEDTAPPTDSPEPSDTIPPEQTATSFTLDKSEFTISDRYPDPIQIKVTFSPAGSTGTVTWTSSDTSVVTVSGTGLVTAVGKGSATITASMPGAADQTCYVISSVTSPSAPSSSPSSSPSASPSQPSSGGLTLSREDFTLNDTWPSYTFEVTGASGSVSWTTSNASVATVDANGKVTKVGNGQCTVTATDSAGKTAQCIVRCS